MVRTCAQSERVETGVTMVVVVLLALLPLRAHAEPEPLSPSALVITEIMYHPPADVEFPMGQWFEVYNGSDDEVTLAGLTVELEGANNNGLVTCAVEWATAPVVPGHGFAVLGASKALALNGGVPVDYAYGTSVHLPKQGGAIRLYFGDALVDEVLFGPGLGAVASPGHSVSLEPAGMTVLDNDEPSFWCESQGVLDAAQVPTWASPGQVGHACDSDSDGFDEASGDCADDDPTISPGAQEKCNGLDDNCNGISDEEPLADMPAWTPLGVCEQGGPVCEGADGYVFVYPDEWQETETACDYLDNDCDGDVDEGLRNSCGGCGKDEPDLCDGLDNDCDGQTDEDAASPPADLQCEGGKVGLCKETQRVCMGDKGWVCVHPVGYEEEETLCDGFDNDCDGETDEGYETGGHCIAGQGACRAEGIMVCAPDRMSVICQADELQGLQELCGDNQDNDCDGETDEGFPVGEACEQGVGMCRVTGKYFCSADRLSVVCSVEPLTPDFEWCGNGLDDDCDGQIDEGDCLETDEETPVGGCGAASPTAYTLTFLLLLFIPMLVPARRRRRA